MKDLQASQRACQQLDQERVRWNYGWAVLFDSNVVLCAQGVESNAMWPVLVAGPTIHDPLPSQRPPARGLQESQASTKVAEGTGEHTDQELFQALDVSHSPIRI